MSRPIRCFTSPALGRTMAHGRNHSNREPADTNTCSEVLSEGYRFEHGALFDELSVRRGIGSVGNSSPCMVGNTFGVFHSWAFCFRRDSSPARKRGRAWLEAYIHNHLWSSIFAIVIVCCLILGTGIYLYVRRPPHVKTEANKPVPVPTAPQITTKGSVAPLPSEQGSTPPTAPIRTPQKPVKVPPQTAAPVPPTAAPPQTVNVDHGIGGIGGTFINPTVNNYVPPDRKIISTDREALRAILRKGNQQSVNVAAPPGDNEAQRLGVQIYSLLQESGWTMKNPIVMSYQIVGGPTDYGITVFTHGEPVASMTTLPDNHPLLLLKQLFSKENLQYHFEARLGTPSDVIDIQIGTVPPN